MFSFPPKLYFCLFRSYIKYHLPQYYLCCSSWGLFTNFFENLGRKKKSPLKNQHRFLLRRSGPDVNLPGFNFLTTLFWTQLTPLNSIFSVMKWMQLEYLPCNYTEQPGEHMHLTGRETQQILVFLIGGNQVKKAKLYFAILKLSPLLIKVSLVLTPHYVDSFLNV